MGKILSGKALWFALVGVFLFGNSIGASLVYKWAQAQEASRLQAALVLANQEREAALASLKTYYENLPPKEVVRTKVKYVIKELKFDPKCDVGPGEHRMLNDARTGLLASSERADASSGETGTSKTSGGLPRGAEVLAHVDAATRYRECRALGVALLQYLTQR